MVINRRHTLGMVVLCVCWVGSAYGQVKKETVTRTTPDGATVTTTWYKSSDVLGRPIIINREPMGKIEDLVIDVPSGRVVYGVGSFTNVKDASGRLYVIPWPATRYSTVTKSYEVNLGTEQLQSAPSFVKTERVNFADEEFATRTFKHYNVTPWWQTEKTTVLTSDRPATTTTTTWTSRPTTTYRVSELRGREIRTVEGTRIGKIEEVVLDPGTGRVLYGVTVRDGRSVPIPWTALRPVSDNAFEVTISAEKWKSAPSFEVEVLPTEQKTEIYRYYEVEPMEIEVKTKVKTDDDDE